MANKVCMDKFRSYRHKAIVAARDLGYASCVVADLHNAKTENEVTRILASARKGEY